MILQMFTVFDRAVQAFGRPFFVTHSGAAIRSFTDEVNNPQSEFHKHPDDYDLYAIGEWDDNTGIFSTFPPDLLIQAKQVQSPVKQSC